MSIDDYVHIPVLVKEVVQGLNVRADGIYVDCTFGRGGHSKAILEQLGSNGKIYAFDKDPEAIKAAKRMFTDDSRAQFYHTAFSNIFRILEDIGMVGKIDGIMFDLGISSPQVEDPHRGFSFSQNGNLDMRMDTTTGMNAAEWLNKATTNEITHILKEYGEEKFAYRIAKAITEARISNPLSTTLELSELISSVVPVREKKKHPATRSFQAIRIYINNELEEIAKGLVQSFELLDIKGRLAVISFHSLEDRIVKRFMREYSENDPFPKDIPITADRVKPRLRIIGKKIRADESELGRNLRSRSATLRIAEKLHI